MITKEEFLKAVEIVNAYLEQAKKETVAYKIDLSEQQILSENILKNKNIIDIKEIAKKYNIKLSDKGKQKNKEILIQEILLININK